MLKRLARRTWGAVRRLGSRDDAAVSSEYASLLGVVIIAVIVSVLMLGQGVRDTVTTVDNRVAQVTKGDAGGDEGGEGGDKKGGGKGGHKKGGGKGGHKKGGGKGGHKGGKGGGGHGGKGKG